MFFNVLKAKDLVDLEDEKFQRKVLMESETGSLSAIAIKKEEIIDTHTSTCDAADRKSVVQGKSVDAAVLVLDGEIEIHFDAEKFKVDKGEILMFKKDTEHKVLALKDSKFLLIKV